MSDKIKDILKDKNKLLMIVPLVLAGLFAFVFFSSGKKEEKNNTENNKTLLEPSSSEERKPNNKVDAYKQDEKEELEKERIERESNVKGSDFYFELQNQKEQYDREKARRVEKLSHNPYETVMSEYEEDGDTGGNRNFSRRMRDQLGTIDDEEEFQQIVKEAKKNARIQKELDKEANARQMMMARLHPSKSPEQTKAKEEKVTQEIPNEQVEEEIEDTPIYKDSAGKRRRRSQINASIPSNLFRACIHGDQTIVSGTPVRMRLLEPVLIGGVRIPANTLFYGLASIGSSRLSITVDNLKSGKYISPVTFVIYDNDAMLGLNLPNNMKATAAKKMQQGLLQGIQMPISSIGTVTSEVTSALTATTQVAKQILNMTLSQTKVYLKANHEMYIQEETKEAKLRRKAVEAELKAMYEQIESQQNVPEEIEPLRSFIQQLQ